MKKKHTALWIVLAVVIVILLAAGGILKKNNMNRQKLPEMLEQCYNSVGKIVAGLEALMPNAAQGDSAYNANVKRLNDLGTEFKNLDRLLNEYAVAFQPAGKSRNTYAGACNFSVIGELMGEGTVMVNNDSINCIQKDGTISSKELQFLTKLYVGMNDFMTSMQRGGEMNFFDPTLSSTTMDNIISDFFTRWDWSNASSPLRLLVE